MHIQRLCLFFARISEAEPLDRGSQAEPRNQLKRAKCFVEDLSDLREGGNVKGR
jgi:hypothetical protein